MQLKRAKIVFNSRTEFFKHPVGAVQAGQLLRLRLLVDAEVKPQDVTVVVEFDRDKSFAVYHMQPEKTKVETDWYLQYTGAFPIHDTGLYWYHFEVETPAGILKIGKSPENRAELQQAPVSWQQTVYNREYLSPKWLEGGVIYQVFVDRFHHVGDYVELPGKITRKDWGNMPEWRPDSNGRILNNDFFGGNLRGVIEKLPYFQKLGVTCLYLSPIFEAYSNHKYDTSDYLKIDPMFGDLEDFRELCQKAEDVGIRIMLDGVFSHTGSDSVYFDKEGRNGHGAYGHPESRYRSWYHFGENESYETWWGIDTLPRLEKNNPEYREFICGQDGVARYWMKQGASGWRLDVADELPNSFIESLAKAVKTENPEGIILGEVWEDASNKSAYDERKNYFSGDKLDSVMNYPFRTGIIHFVRNGNAEEIEGAVQQILENYPKEVVDVLMNSLGTHDTERILTMLGGKDLGPAPGRELQAATVMSPEERENALKLLRIAAVLQMTLPGVPCIYYGDEAGMEGYKDPFNRQCYPWGKEDKSLLEWYKKLIAFRRRHRVYREGSYRGAAAIRGLYAFERYDDHERIITAANCGKQEENLFLSGYWKDVLSGEYFHDNIIVFPGQVLLLVQDFTREGKGENMDYQKNFIYWMEQDLDADTKAELQGISQNQDEIKERFISMLDFGTAGLRGIMRAGLNGMNVYTVRYATQGLAELILECGEDYSGGVTIAYDSRNNSRLFAEEAAGVLAANGISVHIFESLRPTPELSFALRENGSIAGINITASHNTKEYNGYKVYWADGAQLPPEHAGKISDKLEQIDLFRDVKTMAFQQALEQGLVQEMGSEMDEKYLARVLEQSVGRAYVDQMKDSFKIIFTPFHGTGYKLVPEVLKRDGFTQVLTVPEQMVIDGDFPTVASPNPEYVEGFALAIDMAKKEDVNMIIGTDPDGDRCGVVVRTESGEYTALTGNQIGVLLLDFLIRGRREQGILPENSAAVKSIVSTTMANAICQANDITLFETLTGFKYIGEKIKEFEESGEYTYLFGFEESNGYLAGTYARDKDAVVASMLVSEMACWYAVQGMSLYQGLMDLYERYGYYREKVLSFEAKGLDGKERMDKKMVQLREKPPVEIGGLPVLRVRDYKTGYITDIATKKTQSTGLPESNVLFYELEGKCAVAIRPSGTEPKIKMYIMAQGETGEEAEQRLAQVVAAGNEMLAM